MKKQLIALLLTATMLCTLIMPVGASKPDTDSPSKVTILDALEILKHLAKMKSIYDGTWVFPKTMDALEVLKYLAKMTPRPVLPLEREVEYEPKYYSNATIDQDFCGRTVLVMMDKKVGGSDKVHEPSFFGDFPMVSINDLTPSILVILENDPALRELFSEKDIKESLRARFSNPNWRQVLSIYLPIDCKQNVLDVIAILEQVDGILSASPNYYGQWD